jgi:DNA-binding response OmpR family regulator
MSERILVIEDSPTQLLLVRNLLEAEGFVVLDASSGAEGLARAYAELPDLIISDVVMAGINGYQLCRLVKNDPELRRTPVILLTKLEGTKDRFWGLKCGADRFIPKEIGFVNLTKHVKELLETTLPSRRARLLSEINKRPGSEEIAGRVLNLLERMLFEAAIVDEVKKLSQETLDLKIIARGLFELLANVLDYSACALVVNSGDRSWYAIDLADGISRSGFMAYVHRVATQLGLPPMETEYTSGGFGFENAITQPIDGCGRRLGLLVVMPVGEFKAYDNKMISSICEELSHALSLRWSYEQQRVKV